MNVNPIDDALKKMNVILWVNMSTSDLEYPFLHDAVKKFVTTTGSTV